MKLKFKIFTCCLSALALLGAAGCAKKKCMHESGITEEGLCPSCNEILVQKKDPSNLSLKMELETKITFERTEDGTLAVRMRAEMPVEDMDDVCEDIDYQGCVWLTEENYTKYGAVTEESVFGSNAVYTIGTVAGDHFNDKTVKVVEWSKEQDSDGFSAHWVAGGIQIAPDSENIYKRLTTKYVFTCFLRVEDKRYFAEDVTSGMSFYDGIKTAYTNGSGWNYHTPKDASKKIVFTEEEKKYLYENFIKPIETT